MGGIFPLRPQRSLAPLWSPIPEIAYAKPADLFRIHVSNHGDGYVFRTVVSIEVGERHGPVNPLNMLRITGKRLCYGSPGKQVSKQAFLRCRPPASKSGNLTQYYVSLAVEAAEDRVPK